MAVVELSRTTAPGCVTLKAKQFQPLLPDGIVNVPVLPAALEPTVTKKLQEPFPGEPIVPVLNPDATAGVLDEHNRDCDVVPPFINRPFEPESDTHVVMPLMQATLLSPVTL